MAILESAEPDNTGQNAPETSESRLIASHLIQFLSSEVSANRLPKSLLPLQSGIGNVANSIIGRLADGPFEEVTVWTEVLQDTFIRFFDSGKLSFATATSIKFSPEGWVSLCCRFPFLPTDPAASDLTISIRVHLLHSLN